MAAGLLSIPAELLLEITTHLLLPDQAALARTCRTLNRQLTPLVWEQIELHHRGTHEGIDIDYELTAFEHGWLEQIQERRCNDAVFPYNDLVYQRSSRKYLQCELDYKVWLKHDKARKDKRRDTQDPPVVRVTDNINRNSLQDGREEMFIGASKITSEPRWHELAQNVQSLCMSCGIDNEVCGVIGSLKNLKSLELVGLPLSKRFSKSVPEIRIPSLRNVRLRGYIPSAFVVEICKGAGDITHLDLGLIATPADDEELKHSLLFRETDADDNSTESVSSGEPTQGMNESNEIDGIDDEVLPWASHSPVWIPKKLPESWFKSLTHLHLIKPYDGEVGFGDDSFERMPTAYENLVYEGWVEMLRRISGTLRELIIEHRLPMEVGDTVGDGSPEPRRKGRYWNPKPDEGDVMFCRSVLRLLLEHSEDYQTLRRIALRGIQIDGIDCNPTGSDTSTSHQSADNNDVLLRRAFPSCEIEVFVPVYPIYVYAGWIYQHWPENRHEVWQDEGDGLFHSLAVTNDYIRRFGLAWKVSD